MRRYIFILAIFILFLACAEKNTSPDVETHTEAWNMEENKNFHGEYVLKNGSESCQTCHGEDYSGGSSGKSCFSCHASYPHKADFIDPQSSDFHGQYLRNLGYDLSQCQKCHGEDFTLPSAENNCFHCHQAYPHKAGFEDSQSQNFHGDFIRDSNWNLQQCQSCHGANFDGPTSEENCLKCHVNTGGPIACNTCHGSENNDAPPKDLAGNTDPSNPGVGAHQSHLMDSTLTVPVACTECHPNHTSFYDEDHIDETAGITLEFGVRATDSSTVTPVFDPDLYTCENVYCHGNFKFLKENSQNSWIYTADTISGNNYKVTWNKVSQDEAACGTCHGLPPTGHLNNPSCSSCHGRVVDAENNIINKDLHINGKIDVF